MVKTRLIGSILACMLFRAGALGQERIKFSSINTAGFTAGHSGPYGVVQTINGINFENWFSGLGIGIDYYQNKSLPLFFDARRFIAKSNLFLFADPGYNLPLKKRPAEKVYYSDYYRLKGGFYGEGGIGYKIQLHGKAGLLFTWGYSYKKLVFKPGGKCATSSCPLNYGTYEYQYTRLQFKAGISL